MREAYARGVLAAAAAGLVATPFLVVRYPPITDLPQHAAQIRLFLDTLGHPGGPYAIQWLTPYSLGYLAPGAAWLVFGPAHAGRLGMLAIALLSVGVLHWVAARRGRPAAAATLASALVFSHVLYWGFMSFAAGWPVFLLWLGLNTGERARETRPPALLVLGATAAALYLTHALWFAAGLAWLVLHGLVFRVPPRTLGLRLAVVSPVLVAAALWFPRLAARGFTSPTVWEVSPLDRLAPAALVDATFGGLTGRVEGLVFAAIVLSLVLAAWAGRSGSSAWDRECLLAAALLLVLALVLPATYSRTARFAQRWIPVALALGLLAAPALALRRGLARAIALAVLAAFCGATATVWATVERTSLTGLQASLEALPPATRVLGLDWVQFNPLLNLRPFVHLAVYGQVLKGGEVGFSFADLAPSPVVYDPPRARPWTERLEWRPERVQGNDFRYFGYVLVGGGDAVHGYVGRYLQPVTTQGTWRLYRVPTS
jgi:hypothetical protein